MKPPERQEPLPLPAVEGFDSLVVQRDLAPKVKPMLALRQA